MSTDTVATFLALLAALAVALAVTAGVALVVGRSPTPPRWVGDLAAVAVPVAAAIAVTATLGSLYFSEVAHYEPCRLCWYQRIAMYPMAVVLPIAAWRRDTGIWHYAIPLSVAGLLVSIYHTQLQWLPEQGGGVCGTGPPCTLKYVEVFGLVTIPSMAGAGFLAITALLLLAGAAGRAPEPVGGHDPAEDR